jgi:transcriptional regulator with XRE-family HTH domain
MSTSFASWLTKARVAAGMSSYRLAQLAGITKQAVSNLELGKRQPTLDTAIKLARVLGVGLDALVMDNSTAAAKPAKRKKAGK